MGSYTKDKVLRDMISPSLSDKMLGRGLSDVRERFFVPG